MILAIVDLVWRTYSVSPGFLWVFETYDSTLHPLIFPTAGRIDWTIYLILVISGMLDNREWRSFKGQQYEPDICASHTLRSLNGNVARILQDWVPKHRACFKGRPIQTLPCI